MEGGLRHRVTISLRASSSMACEDCLNRREFLAKSALAAAALAALEACGNGQIGPPVRNTGGDPNQPTGGPFTIRIADQPGLGATGTLVDIGHDRAVIRTAATTFVAFSKICTHQQCTTDVRNNEFECPCHGSRFANDGSVLNGPNIPSPPIGPLLKLAVTFNAGDGTITVA